MVPNFLIMFSHSLLMLLVFFLTSCCIDDYFLPEPGWGHIHLSLLHLYLSLSDDMPGLPMHLSVDYDSFER